MVNELKINLEGFEYQDLFKPEKLKLLTELFYSKLNSNDPELYHKFVHYSQTKGEGCPLKKFLRF